MENQDHLYVGCILNVPIACLKIERKIEVLE